MTNSIWRSKHEKPKPYNAIFKIDEVVGCGVDEVTPDDDYSQCRDSFRWCYVDDLLNLEKENATLKRALETANDSIEWILRKGQKDNNDDWVVAYDWVKQANKTIKKINKIIGD